ncbi:uncharacterized protein LOC107484836 [Arachis duranensis]|uniref:Uncharacterized protein LOC107484836 n=1 Tax=Arachis duranensis TaxID=130453 RepID=A0A6P4D290_ARADU|nr:uncharacterized protein LOC107484836 [Arachis duranensis]
MRIKRMTSNGKWNMSDVDIAHMNSLREVGISIPKIYQSFAMQVGGFNLVKFTNQDMHNEVRKQRALQEGDVNAVLQEDYQVFGDVLAIDATYDRNKYNLPVIVLSGVIHYNQTCVFATAMVSQVDEFKSQWEAMIEEYGVQDVEWASDLYRKKHSLATTYLRGRFFVGIRTTSRCESLHTKMGRFVDSQYGIIDFITNFKRCIDFVQDKEEE